MSLHGIIFDLDGVLCSTDEYHYRAWKALADSICIPFDRTVNERLRGISRMDSLEIILETSAKTYTPEEKRALADRKNARYRELLQNLSPKDADPVVISTLQALKQHNFRLCVASSSKNARFILDRLGLAPYFDGICDGNQITHAKPDPEVFLKAAAMLRLSPSECLVVEDAVAGAQAAHAGGFLSACVGDASKKHAGDYNLTRLPDLLSICTASQKGAAT